MSDVRYWLWMQGGLGYGKAVKSILSCFDDIKAVYEADDSLLKDAGITPKLRENLHKKTLEDYNEVVNFCEKHSLKIVTPDSEFYPKNLLLLEDYPLALFVRGDATCLKEDFSIAVIGTRTPSAYGEESARGIVESLCENDTLIVSGGALGIDSIAHMSAMNSGGKTVLVLGYGHGTEYLPENAPLRKSVTGHGAVISEYPPFYPVTKGSFPVRNRIISGMSKGVVIIEAAQGSGTFSTARHAKSQGIPVFVLPGDIKSGRFAGSNQLISDGAIPVFSGWDILKNFPERKIIYRKCHGNGDIPFSEIEKDALFSTKKKKTKREKPVQKEATVKTDKKISRKIPEDISKNAEIVYNIMSEGVTFLDEITRKSGLEVRKVLIALTELEMTGVTEMSAPNQYELK